MPELLNTKIRSASELLDGYRMTELGPLPEEWQVVRLGEVVTISRKPRGLTMPNNVPVIPMGVIPDDGRLYPSAIEWRASQNIHSGTYCEGGDILFAKITPSLENGKQAIVPPELNCAYATTEVYPLKLTSQVDSFFLFALLRAPWVRENLAGKMEGSTGRQRLTKQVLLMFPIPLPPLPEQRAIAHVLRTVQEAKEATEGVIAALRELKKSLMRHLFTYGPVPIDQADQVPLKETEIGPMPEHWRVVRLGEVTRKPQYGYTASAAQEPVGPKFLRITDIQNDRVHWSTVPFCTIQDDLLDKYQLQAGDMLFARIGATTGKTYLVTKPPKSVFASYLIRVRTYSGRLLAEYLYFFTQAPLYWQQINAAKGGRLKQGINIPILTSLLIPLPPLDEQGEIARILQAADRKIEAEEARKEALGALFKSLLHHLMTGKIRVRDLAKQD